MGLLGMSRRAQTFQRASPASNPSFEVGSLAVLHEQGLSFVASGGIVGSVTVSSHRCADGRCSSASKSAASTTRPI